MAVKFRIIEKHDERQARSVQVIAPKAATETTV
jgi:hypothetical protein